MKVAFIAPKDFIIQYDALLIALRSVVGTTEFFGVDPSNHQLVKKLLISNDWDSRFDRVVFLLEPQLLVELRQYIQKHCQHPVLLSLDNDRGQSKDSIFRLMKFIPWMRWIGVQLSLSLALNQQGFDAYPIKPINPVDVIGTNKKPGREPYFYIYQVDKPPNLVKLPEPIELPVKAMYSLQPNNIEQIKKGDIFLYLTNDEHYDPLPSIQAMARGAIVISLKLDSDICAFYGLQDGQNCIFIEHVGQIAETVKILLSNNDVGESISLAGIETATHYSQSVIGRELGMGLMLPMRVKKNYRQKLSPFGLRI